MEKVAFLAVLLTLSACTCGSRAVNVTDQTENCEQVYGESEHNVTRLQEVLEEESDSGLFVSREPIGFNGTIRAINASGFCPIAGRTSQPFGLRVLLYNNTRRVSGHNLEADCSMDGSETSNSTIIGRVELTDVNIPVLPGYSVAIRFNSRCNQDSSRCTFRPTTVDTNTQDFIFYVGNSSDDFRNLGKLEVDTVGLQFSYSVRRNSPQCTPKDPKDPDILFVAIIIVLSVIILLLLSAFSAGLLYKHYHSRRKRNISLELENNFTESVENASVQHNISASTSTQLSSRNDSGDLRGVAGGDAVVTSCVLWRLVKRRRKSDQTLTESITDQKLRQNEVDLEGQLMWKLQNMNKILFSKTQIQLSSTIGQGEFGLVYKGYVDNKHGTVLVAIKTSKVLSSERERENLLKEIQIMASFEHVNVMTLIGVCLDGEMPLIIMPFMTKGCVLDYVRHKKDEQLQEVMTRSNFLGMCHQIAKGMKYLADYKFVHRDIAARNCMIDEHNVIKVADFGLCEDVYSYGYFCQGKDGVLPKEEKVPIRWMAPESIEGGKYSEKTDVWAFGVTCWEIFTFGRVPYTGIRAMSILNLLKSGERLEKPANTICSDQIYDVMMTCWSEVSRDRPNFANLVDTIADVLEKESGYLELN